MNRPWRVSVPSRLAVAIASLLAACAQLREGGGAGARAEPPSGADPTKREVAVPALGGWNGTLVIDQAPVGIWTVMPFKVFPQNGCTELVAIDDLGRCHVLWSYSGKWTPVTAIGDGTWLGGLAQADVDPRIPGRELYTGARSGHVYQVVAYRDSRLDHRRIASVGAREVHTLVAGELDPRTPGEEVLAFTNPGGLFRLRPRADGLDGFDVELLEELPGRIRDALVVPDGRGGGEVLTVGRDGAFRSLAIGDEGPRWTTIHERPMGMGRVALAPDRPGRGLVAYVACDDGVVVRHERDAGGSWRSEIVYAGAQGLRGIAAGRFDADPDVETFAVCGYSSRVELVTRRGDRWEAETILLDLDKGHWICRAEVDGRNGTDELAVTGYSARVVLLSRPPGYALDAPGAAVSAPGSEGD